MDVFSIASFIGSVAFALSGFFAGVRHKLDFMGIFIVSMLTANGGGAIRDVLVGRTPNVLKDINAFYLVCAVIALAWVFKLYRFATLERSAWFVMSDAVGLVAFGLTGAIIGIEADLTIFGVMVLSFLTASGGGIIRDLMVNQVPSILNSDFYGSVAILIALSLYALEQFEMRSETNMIIVLLIALIIRLIAWRKAWQLPRANF